MIKYLKPDKWMKYDIQAVVGPLVEAKSAIKSLQSLPYQKSWAERLQQMQLKREVAGTSRIEGADFTEEELAEVMEEKATSLDSRSLRQADAARRCYQWIESLPVDIQISKNLLLDMHKLLVEGADDDHCPVGRLRNKNENVTFGVPPHRGVEGGKACEEVFNEFIEHISADFNEHDSTIQALAAHYYLAAMHPFLDGNGRTVRAMEAVMLRRADLRSSLFIAMSNYYYEEKPRYLEALAEVRAQGNDLTPFLVFGLKGIQQQCERLSRMISTEISKALYVNMTTHLFTRMRSKRKRALAKRQLGICHRLLEQDRLLWADLYPSMALDYKNLKNPAKAFIRDVNGLIHLDAIKWEEKKDALGTIDYKLTARLEWPEEITETSFFEMTKNLPKSKKDNFLPTTIR